MVRQNFAQMAAQEVRDTLCIEPKKRSTTNTWPTFPKATEFFYRIFEAEPHKSRRCPWPQDLDLF